jgi:hypothetical protein
VTELTGEQIYRNFQDGAGTDGLLGSAAILNEIRAEYDDIASEVYALRGEMESAWQGEASGAARRGAGPVAAEYSEAAMHLYDAQDLTTRQTGSFERGRNAVVPVPPEPDAVQPWVSASPEGATYQNRLGHHNAAAQQNVDVMSGYGNASDHNTVNLPDRYGELIDDQAGFSVGPTGGGTDTTGTDASGDTGRGSDAGGGTPGGPGPGPVAGGHGPAGGPGAATPPPGAPPAPGNGTTTPGGYTPIPGGGPGVLPGIEPGQVRPAPSTGGLVPGVGVGFPGAASGGGAPGGSGGGPRGSAGGPVAGGPLRGGPGAGAEPHGQNARPTSATGAAPGRAGTPGMGGMPLGGGRSRGDEDTERKTPAYLEGGDPEDLYGSELLTAPPVIGDEDDD